MDVSSCVLWYGVDDIHDAWVQEGKPKIYISHGTNDEVLSIDYCSRRLAPRLQKQGYDVKYHEFEGPHTVPRSICQEGIQWFLGEPVA